MTMVLRGHDNSNYEKQSSKKYVFRREQKTVSDGTNVICCGRLFRICTAVTGKARLPSVEYEEQTVRRFKTPTLLEDDVRQVNIMLNITLFI